MAGGDVITPIPARFAAPRLPGKPLADIGGQPMIAHVLARARAAGVGEGVVATALQRVCEVTKKAGGRGPMRGAAHVSAPDRIFGPPQHIAPQGRAAMPGIVQGAPPPLDPAISLAALVQ